MPNTADHVSDQSQNQDSTESKIIALRLQSQSRDDGCSVEPGEGCLAEAPRSTMRALQQTPDLLVTIPGLFGQPLRQQAGAALTAGDQRWFAELTTRWVRGGCPADLRISFSHRDALEFLGDSVRDASPLELLRASLLRLRSWTVESPKRRPHDGEEATLWGLLERASLGGTGSGPVQGWAEFNRQVAEVLQEPSVTYLHAPTWDRLRERDELASRLWVFLETQEMPTLGRRYDLFAASSDGVSRRRSLPAVAELTELKESVLRRQTVDRIRQAAKALVELDHRYVTQVVKAGAPGMWRLEVRRRAGT
jgi:hypothetical protein